MSESKEIMKWADKSMYTAEPSEREKGIRASLVGCDPDPLGLIAVGGLAYTGRTIRDTRMVTDEERRYFLGEIAKTALKAPLEFVRFVFVIEGVHRGITHQMVRQRTAVYVQESQRFAVKEDTADAVALPPSLADTLSLSELVSRDLAERLWNGLFVPDKRETHEIWFSNHQEDVREAVVRKGGAQAWRLRWDDHVEAMAKTYMGLIDDGMPAEDARGLLPTNILTKIQYSTTLRGFYDTMAMRVSDQAQFEWRQLVTAMVVAMREFGKSHRYQTWMTREEYEQASVTGEDVFEILSYEGFERPSDPNRNVLVSRNSLWQFRELSQQIRPLDFILGKRAFGAAFDRASRIAERVDAFSLCGVPSSEWTKNNIEFQIPGISPDEWLLDPGSARLKANQEFDVFGNRVTEGRGAHWDKNTRRVIAADGSQIEIV